MKRNPKQVFVTGTDTGVGKTVVSGFLAHRWQGHYWKPVQSGTVEGRDLDEVLRLGAKVRILPSRYELREPLSPHLAARLEGKRIVLSDFELPRVNGPLVVEGAGGVLVPLNEKDLMLDLMRLLALPVVLVARSSLGTINHTLLTLQCLRAAGIPVVGVVLNGPPNQDNLDAIVHFGSTRVLAELPPLELADPHCFAGVRIHDHAFFEP